VEPARLSTMAPDEVRNVKRKATDEEIMKLYRHLRKVDIPEVVAHRMVDGAKISVFENYKTDQGVKTVMAVVWPQDNMYDPVFILEKYKAVVYEGWE